MYRRNEWSDCAIIRAGSCSLDKEAILDHFPHWYLVAEEADNEGGTLLLHPYSLEVKSTCNTLTWHSNLENFLSNLQRETKQNEAHK